MNLLIIIKFLLGSILVVESFPQQPTEIILVTDSKKNESLANNSDNKDIEKNLHKTEQSEEPKSLQPAEELPTASFEAQIEPPPTTNMPTSPVLIRSTTKSPQILPIETTKLPLFQNTTETSTISPLPLPKTTSPPTAHAVIKGNQPGCIKGNSVYCEQLEDAEINKMIKVIQHLNKTDTYFTENPKELAQRRNDPAEDVLCHSVERYIYPQSAKNRENEWRYIVNNGRFTQAVRVEECTLVGSPCQLSPKFPATYQSECRQKYIYHNLLGYDSDGKVVKDFYKLPSCCQCFVKPRK